MYLVVVARAKARHAQHLYHDYVKGIKTCISVCSEVCMYVITQLNESSVIMLL